MRPYRDFDGAAGEIDDGPDSGLFRQQPDERDAELAVSLQNERLDLDS